MLRRQSRLRREYIYKKSLEARRRSINDKKELFTRNLSMNASLNSNIQKDALKLQNNLKYDAIENETLQVDDEYRYSGSEDPNIMITTSHEPSSRLKMFVKELRLLFPNAKRMNRGKYELKQLMHACKAHDITDFIIVHEHRGVPDNLVVCHLPHGPTAFFNISNVIMRHDIPNIGPLSEQKPHLIFHNFKTALAERTMKILKHLFPVPKINANRVITFANHEDCISFRHHTFQSNNGLKLTEIGPRFELTLYQIKLGTLEEINAAKTEWVLRPYINTTSKRLFLSDRDAWNKDEK